ncbi:TPA: sacsin N-terminal ATP-binding-like domain-containing protein, partial [Vibrio diabolicus]
MISAYNREVETEKEYNGRQLLELLQNADDENSDEVRIELDTKANLLSIKNRGNACRAFSANGIRSLMISNLSTKTSKKFIGNKGLGFRSIINWSESISIRSSNLKIDFSRKIVNKVFDDLFSTEEQQNLREERNLPDTIFPIPFLSVPHISDDENQDWVTAIDIYFKSQFLKDIQKQIDELKSEVLLFLNSINRLTVIVDGQCIKSIDKDSLHIKWSVYERKGKLPVELWDKENETEFFDLKIALQNNLECNIRKVFSYFPTKLVVDFPFIIHGTFELNSSRNELIDSLKNRYILKELVNLIIDTAKSLASEETSYKALELLSYKYPNNILSELGFYDEIDKAIENLDIFPCLDGKYRKKSDVIYIEPLSIFVSSINRKGLFENLLIPTSQLIDLSNMGISGSVDTDKLTELSKSIECMEERASMIYMFHQNFRHEEKLEFLIDSQGDLISLDDEVYTPSSVVINVPDYVSIKFIHEDLFELLAEKFGVDSNEKARELQRLLKEITNIQQYQPTPVLQKIVSNANRLIRGNVGDAHSVITKMVVSLYENYKRMSSPNRLPDAKIQLISKSGDLLDA